MFERVEADRLWPTQSAHCPTVTVPRPSCSVYYEGLTLAEIGSILELTGDPWCQLRARALKHLRFRLVEPSV